jgi:hypothetical protein
MGGSWFHSTLFFSWLRLVSFGFAGFDNGLGVLSNLRVEGGFSIAPEETESRADSVEGD